jgi:hypothetical protein
MSPDVEHHSSPLSLGVDDFIAQFASITVFEIESPSIQTSDPKQLAKHLAVGNSLDEDWLQDYATYFFM